MHHQSDLAVPFDLHTLETRFHAQMCNSLITDAILLPTELPGLERGQLSTSHTTWGFTVTCRHSGHARSATTYRTSDVCHNDRQLFYPMTWRSALISPHCGAKSPHTSNYWMDISVMPDRLNFPLRPNSIALLTPHQSGRQLGMQVALPQDVWTTLLLRSTELNITDALLY